MGLLLCHIIYDCKLAGVSSFVTAACLISLFAFLLFEPTVSILIAGFDIDLNYLSLTFVDDLITGLPEKFSYEFERSLLRVIDLVDDLLMRGDQLLASCCFRASSIIY